MHELFLAGATTAALLGVWARMVEPNWLKLTSHRISLSSGRWNSPIRLLHLSDFHLTTTVNLMQRAISLGLSARPDLICLTGDFITAGKAYERKDLVTQLGRLAKAAPTYATLGNHDGGAWGRGGQRVGTQPIRDLLENAGVQVLHNAWKEIALEGRRLTLVGVGDLWSREMDPRSAFENLPSDAPVILLCHNPDGKDDLAGFPWNLMLSGHTHGGQVVLPILGRRLAPVRDREYASGLKPWRGRLIYVTNGIGSLGGIRFNCRPEVSLLEID
jgi:predicted MPP superfamily phosphohydrolase